MKGVQGGVPQEGDHRDKELRADDIHFIELVRDVDDAGIIVFAVGFEHSDEDGIFAIFLATIFVEFFQEVFVFVLRASRFVLVFHFKHNRYNFVPCFVALAENIITFTAASLRNGVVFLEIGITETGGAKLVELGLAMLLEAFADHLRRKAGFHVFVIGDHVVFVFKLKFVLCLQVCGF